jgi:glycosyltransferase involved in cell wall biosynthesis
MNIYFLLPSYGVPGISKASGGTISNYHLINSFSKFSKTSVITSFSPIEGVSRRNDEIMVFRATKSYNRSIYFTERLFNYRRRIRRTLESNGQGVLIASRGAIPESFRIAKENGLKFGLIIRAYEEFELTKKLDHQNDISIFRKLDGFFSKRKIDSAFEFCDFIITNSNHMRTLIQEHFTTKAKIFVIYPPIDLERKPPKIKEIEIIGFVNKGQKKGQDIVLALAHRFPSIEFFIYGKTISSGLKNLVNKGYERDREKLFSSIDLMLAPSNWDEPFGRVAAESVWQGKPILVSNRGGLPEATQENFFVISDNNVETWVEKINVIVKNPKIMEDRINNAQEKLYKIATEESQDKKVEEIIAHLKNQNN